ncbi:hypothetical protein KPH14_003562 [Odynerus spinipes]|uniref:Uncharacterized protein n=1 Tax=Odynerus spinipes TaxID=1348599 RepID=A0AAD9VK08_9HYME|nr:hypothetical protein KPH14_003562 [Odynerus spinipes]
MKYNYLPPLSNIRSSLKTRSREYILENSLHGVPYFADPTRPLCERGVWFVLTMASVGATIFTIITIWNKFQEEPTVTGLDTEVSDVEITFPQVFVCFDGNKLNYSGVNDLEKKFYEKIYDWQWGEEINNTIEGTIPKTVKNYREIFARLAPDCDAVLTMFLPDKFVKVITPAGICCKYIVTTVLGIKDNPWGIIFSSAIYPFRLYLMNPSDVGPMRDASPVLKLRRAARVRLEVHYTYATSDLKMLSRYQRQCYYEGEQSTYNNCRLNCVSNDIFKKCRCLPWFLIENGRFKLRPWRMRLKKI